MNFKAGDLVTPKRNLAERKRYGGLTLFENMKKELYSRPYWIIKKIQSYENSFFSIDVEGSTFVYTSEMFEPLLSVGKVVQLNDDSLAFVAESDYSLCVSGPEHWFPLDCLDKNLTYKDTSIKRVYGLSSANMHAWKLETIGRECIWERKTEKREMTIAEIEKKLGYSIKVIKEDGKEHQF